jgi:hypothetical protein
MIVVCPKCAAQNRIAHILRSDGAYRCGRCKHGLDLILAKSAIRADHSVEQHASSGRSARFGLPALSILALIIKHRIVVPVATFFALILWAGLLVGPTTCSDGWNSSSIGTQGACSWHGGVGTNWSAVLATAISFAVAFALWMFLERAARNGIACSECGYPLRLRVAKRGRHKGRQFWGCSRYPSCKGKRPLTSKEEAENRERCCTNSTF